MNLLPKVYYAISKDDSATSFSFKGVIYEVKAGENLFPSLKEANEFIKEPPTPLNVWQPQTLTT